MAQPEIPDTYPCGEEHRELPISLLLVYSWFQCEIIATNYQRALTDHTQGESRTVLTPPNTLKWIDYFMLSEDKVHFFLWKLSHGKKPIVIKEYL